MKKQQDDLEKILMSIYYDTITGGWSIQKCTPQQRDELRGLAFEDIYRDIDGKTKYRYKLTDSGRVVLSFLRRKLNRVPDNETPGMVLEKRTWSMPHVHNMTPDEFARAAKDLGIALGIKVEVHDNWTSGQKRIIFHDLEEGLVSRGVKVGWDKEEFMKRYSAPENAADLFEVFSKHTKEIRDNGAQAEFVVW